MLRRVLVASGIVLMVSAALAADYKPGPIYVQGDHSDADYRNMVLRPVCSSGI